MGLLDRIAAVRRPEPAGEKRYTFDQWIADYFTFGGSQYGIGTGSGIGLTTTYGSQKAQEFATSLPSYTAAIKACPPAFASELVRALVISQARFTWRNLGSSGSPRKTFGTQALAPLETPWPGARTGALLSRMEWHAGLAGNAYVARPPGQQRLRILRPDWTATIYGSESEPELAPHALDSTLLGYAYWNGGLGVGQVHVLLPEEVAHWAPIPDPLYAGLGMSWLTPAIRDIQGDQMAAAHKIKFFENGAAPNLVITGLNAANKEEFNKICDMLEERHAGVANAFRTLYLTQGADATVIGSNFQQMDFKAITGAAENRIAFLSRVPASLLGISEGLSGSSLNAGNFIAARRTFADTWVLPTLQDLCACLDDLVKSPDGAELWFDTSDIPLLREDAADAAKITQTQAATIGQLVRDGFTPDSARAAVIAQDMTQLVHSGLISVQLIPLGAAPPPPATPPAAA